MAILQVLGSDKSLTLNDYNLLNMVESFDWAPNFNAQDVNEMGNTGRVATTTDLETSGSFRMTATGHMAGVLARMKPVKDGAGVFQRYQWDSAGVSGVNAYVITQDDLSDIKFDLIVKERPNQRTFTRSVLLPCSYLTSIAGTIDSNGMAMETYNFAGQYITGFNTPFHDIRSIPAKRVTGTQVQLVSDSGANLTSVGSGTHTAAFLFVDGRPITNRTTDATYVALSTLGVANVTTSAGFVIPVDAQCQLIVYQTTPSTTFAVYSNTDARRFALNTPTEIPYFVKAYMANIYLAPVDAGAVLSSEKWLKVQSMDFNVDLRMETLREINENLQGTSIYARVPTYPFDVSVNATATETDWADWKTVMTKTFTGSQVHDNTYDFASASLKIEFAVVVEYKSRSGRLLETKTFSDLRMEGYGTRQAIGGRGEISWSLKGTKFKVEGKNS